MLCLGHGPHVPVRWSGADLEYNPIRVRLYLGFTVALLVFFAPRVIQNIANPFLWLLYFLCRSFICSNFLVRLTIKRLAMAPPYATLPEVQLLLRSPELESNIGSGNAILPDPIEPGLIRVAGRRKTSVRFGLRVSKKN